MRGPWRFTIRLGAVLLPFVSMGLHAEAGDPPFPNNLFPRRAGIVPHQPFAPSNVALSPGLGSFYPNPVLWVAGTNSVGRGYAPIEGNSGQSLELYGPLSAFRATAMPVQTYSRGYDGRLMIIQGTSLGYPNRPGLSPNLNPAVGSRFPRWPNPHGPMWWQTGQNWVDQN